jgi:asparagine synthase (glutamine-hydrolysing)
MALETESIKNILTLRYDSLQIPVLPKKKIEHFQRINENPSLEKIESIMKTYLKNTINLENPKLSVSLSGGVDSTLVLGLLRKTFPDSQIDAVSIKFSNSVDETKEAAKIAKFFNAEHHILEIDNYLEKLPSALNSIRLPFWDIHWFYIAEYAQKFSKYIASGDGGDEIFGGYTFRYQKFLQLTNNNSTPLEKVKAYLDCHERDRVPDQPKLFGSNCKFSWEDMYKSLLPYFDNKLSPLEQVFLADYNGKLLYNFSLVNNRIMEKFDLKLITPLLSKDLIDYALPMTIQNKYEQKSNIGKLMLRKILKKFNVDSLMSNEKLGFNVNTINLWKMYGHRICTEYLLDGEILQNKWISKKWMMEHINKTDLDIKYVNKFLGLLALEIWHRLFITKTMKPNMCLK